MPVASGDYHYIAVPMVGRGFDANGNGIKHPILGQGKGFGSLDGVGKFCLEKYGITDYFSSDHQADRHRRIVVHVKLRLLAFDRQAARLEPDLGSIGNRSDFAIS